MWRRGSRFAGISVLVALLLVPLGLGAHHAHHLVGSRSCATCVVTQHSPAITAPALTVSAAVLGALQPMPEPVLLASRVERSPQVGRAPPLSAPRQTV